MTEGLELESSVEDATLSLLLSGCLDIYTSADAKCRIETLLSERTFDTVVLDLEHVEYIDSAGLAVVVWLGKARAHDGETRIIVKIGSHPARLFQLSRLEVLLNVEYRL